MRVGIQTIFELVKVHYHLDPIMGLNSKDRDRHFLGEITPRRCLFLAAFNLKLTLIPILRGR